MISGRGTVIQRPIGTGAESGKRTSSCLTNRVERLEAENARLKRVVSRCGYAAASAVIILAFTAATIDSGFLLRDNGGRIRWSVETADAGEIVLSKMADDESRADILQAVNENRSFISITGPRPADTSIPRVTAVVDLKAPYLHLSDPLANRIMMGVTPGTGEAYIRLLNRSGQVVQELVAPAE